MPAPDKHQSVPEQQDVMEDYSFDDLARGLARGDISRGRALKLAGAAVAGGALSKYAEKITISMISQGTAEENRAKTSEHGLRNVLLQEDWEVGQSSQASGAPSAVFVQSDGTIGSPVVAGPELIKTLITQAVGPATKKIGESAPPIKLPDLNGRTVELTDFEGERTLLLFWNPGCGFCQQMLDDLKALEGNPAEGAPQILVISAGTLEANEMMGLHSRVVLDQEFTAGSSYGVTGTPSAVLVDAQGKIASEVAVGAQAVLKLATTSKTKPQDFNFLFSCSLRYHLRISLK